MKLIHIKTNQTVVEFTDQGTAHFQNRFLEKQMLLQGIPIPSYLRKEFNGRSVVFLGDPDFQRAFKEVYSPAVFDPSMYQWE